MRNGVEGRESSLAELLAPAGVVERYHDVGIVDLEIGRRIVEGEVAVLADAREADVHLPAAQESIETAELGREIGVASDRHETAEAEEARDEPVVQV